MLRARKYLPLSIAGGTDTNIHQSQRVKPSNIDCHAPRLQHRSTSPTEAQEAVQNVENRRTGCLRVASLTGINADTRQIRTLGGIGHLLNVSPRDSDRQI